MVLHRTLHCASVNEGKVKVSPLLAHPVCKEYGWTTSHGDLHRPAIGSPTGQRRWHESLRYLAAHTPSIEIFSGASWRSYCDWRKLPYDAPAPLVMTFPLTLWYGAQTTSLEIKGRANLTVLIAGASREVTLRYCFIELFNLWRDLEHLHLIFVGPDVSGLLHGQVQEYQPGGHARGRCAASSCIICSVRSINGQVCTEDSDACI